MALLDYEGSSHVTLLPRMDLDGFNVVACFRDNETAAAALTALQENGIPSRELQILGHRSDAVHSGTGMTHLDERLVTAVARDAVIGGIVGGIAGALCGLIPWAAGGLGDGLAAAVLAAGSIFGAVSGSMLGGEVGFDRSQAGSDTYGDQVEDGATLVDVHTDDEQEASLALSLLERCTPMQLSSFRPGEEPLLV